MPDVAPIAGDYSCHATTLPTGGPDPAELKGVAIDLAESGLGDAMVEARRVDGDGLLASATSANTNFNRGKYSMTVATGGVALRTYRVLRLAGHIDAYGYDPVPTKLTPQVVATLLLTTAQVDAYYAAAGLIRDPAKGTLWLDISDCAPAYVAGATIETPSGTVFYLDDQLAIDTSLTATKSGAILVLNADPGETDITVHAGPVVYRSWPVVVRPGVLTQSDRLP